MPRPALLPMVASLASAIVAVGAVAAVHPEPEYDDPSLQRDPNATGHQIIEFDSAGQPLSDHVHAGARPASAGRVVRLFDFEERDTNPIEVPAGWLRGQDDPEVRTRPGFPAWNRAALDYTSEAVSGIGTARLPTSGGSTSLLLRSGVVGVFPGADYLATARVRTQGLTHARAMLVARLLDQQGNAIAGSEVRSEPMHTRGAWRRATVTVRGDFDDAAFLQSELLLLQPEQLADITAGRFESPHPEFPSDAELRVWSEDYTGDAWFDDLAVIQLPRIEIATTSSGNVIAAPADPELAIAVRDLTGENLTAELTVADINGTVVAQQARTLPGGRMAEDWTPELPRYGWYRATVALTSVDGPVGSASVDFAWLAPEPELPGATTGRVPPERRRFGVIARRVPPEGAEALPALVGASGAGRVTLPVWSATTSLDEHNAAIERITPAVDAMLGRWQQLTLALPEVPPDLASLAGVDSHDVLGLLATNRSMWTDYVDPLLDRYGQRVRRWQIGDALLGVGGAPTPDMAAQVAVAEQALSALVPGPIVVLPWRTDEVVPPDLLRSGITLASLVIPGTPDDALELLAQDWRSAADESRRAAQAAGHEPAELVLAFERLDPEIYGRRAATAEIVKRAVVFWQAFGDGVLSETTAISLVEPWTWSRGRNTMAMPTPELVAWRTAIARLAGRRVVADVHLTPGARALLLASAPDTNQNRPGAMVIWRDGSGPDYADIYLGPGDVTLVDLAGNRYPAQADMTERLRLPYHRVPVNSEPVFIENVDVPLVQFLTAIHLDPDLVRSESGEHEHELVLKNPWDRPVRGRFYIVEPGGYSDGTGPANRLWRIDPRVSVFAIAPNGETRVPLGISFGASEETGEKQLVLDIELTADQDYGLVRTSRRFELGLPELELTLQSRTAPGGDIAVDATVRNRATQPVGVRLTALAPGKPRSSLIIGAIEPGESIRRAFQFTGIDTSGENPRVTVVAELIDSDGRVTASVPIVP